MCYADDRRVPPGGGIILALLAALIVWALIFGLARAASAQESRDTSRTWYIMADTAGIAPVAGQPNVYITWVFAAATPTAFPSSGVLVAWDCGKRKVKRIAQVKYEMASDSTISGNIQEVDRPWQDVSDERLYAVVCSIGPTHVDTESVVPAPTSPQPYFAPGKPRTDA